MLKRIILILLILILFACCTAAGKQSFDGKDRPSVSGQLQVIDGRLCAENGQPVMLRGISNNGVSLSHMYCNDDTYHAISHDIGANVMRLALYTWGVGSVGYCTGGDQDLLMQDIENGVAFCQNQDMYAIIDWHILEDGDPNIYLKEALAFFETVSQKFADSDNVIYEICNEPNHCSWEDICAYAEQIIPVIRSHDPDAVILVGTPNWSQDVDVAAEDPLPYGNLMYVLHFYSATHRQSLRDKAQTALDLGLPLFVSEFGITASSGGFPVDTAEADIWIDFLEEHAISYVMWNFSRTAEPCAALTRVSLKTKDFQPEDFSEAGKWLIDTIRIRSGQQ